jgi:hypothetical protein
VADILEFHHRRAASMRQSVVRGKAKPAPGEAKCATLGFSGAGSSNPEHAARGKEH